MSLGTVTWVLDAAGKYEVSSGQHLLQLMHKGALYTDAGDAPAAADYWAANSEYVQTADIDLATHHEHIAPIGSSSDVFAGSFDGGSHSISNWSYGNADNSVLSAGLFGKCSGSTLQNVRLAGVWTVGGFGAHCGFLCAYIDGESSVYNCEGNFEPGTTMSGDPAESTKGGLGTLIGNYTVSGGSIHGLTVRGTIDMARTSTNTGGVIGRALSGNHFSIARVRNLATFPSGIKSNLTAGGIIGDVGVAFALSNFVNAMNGDIESNHSHGAGGVFGRVFGNNVDTVVYNVVNAMTGNIGNATGAAGGIVGLFESFERLTQFSLLMNYMNGDINGNGGGLFGTVYCILGRNKHSVTNSIVAMNGAVDEAAVHYVRNEEMTGGVYVVVNTEFGMTHGAANNFTPETSVGEGFMEHSLLPGLPYVNLGGTDEKGNVYDWDFVYANVGGNAKFSAYTHATLHTGKMSTPFVADFGTLGDHQMTLSNTSTGELFKHGSMDVVSTNATTVLECQFPPTWVIDADGNYEVSSPEHLLQIMHRGALYTDDGDSPTSYWGSKYVQTRDIDLLHHQTHITPIGDKNDVFTGDYDGGGFEIRNWAYGNTDNSILYAGLFGYTRNSILQNIRLAGVWSLGGFGHSGGFLCASLQRSNLYNCEGNFDQGTNLAGGTASAYFSGALLGESGDSTIHGLTLRGAVNLEHCLRGRGCVIGMVYGSVSVSYVRNLATFPSGNTSDWYCGGVIGYAGADVSISNILNAMHGDLEGTGAGGTGGVFGCVVGASLDAGPVDSVINSMTGNISGINPGGIAGLVKAVANLKTIRFSKMANYATGNIDGGGGIFGQFDSRLTGDLSYELENSIVAMNGSVGHAVIGSVTDVPMNTVDVVVNTDFGMTFTTNDYTPATAVGEGFVEDALFPDLPCIEFSSTDEKGNVYDWDFVYGNVGGKADYSEYTHAILHKGKVSSPFFADFGPLTERHLAYANSGTGELFSYGDGLLVSTDAPTHVNRLSPLTWVVDANGSYEVSSAAHLVQIMLNGARYTDEGDAPPSSDYWASSSKFIQTTDIDLSNLRGIVVPIGNTSSPFAGSYDGGGFEIRHWATADSSVDNAGLFGLCSGSTLQNIRLAGVWTIEGYEVRVGFLCGYLKNGGAVFNCEGNFEQGTTMSCKPSQGGVLGTLIGQCDESAIHGLTVRGTVDFVRARNTVLAGVIGQCIDAPSITRVRNLGTFPSGIKSGESICAGVIGAVHNYDAISNIVNAMHGDIESYYGAGVIGATSIYDSEKTSSLDNIVNTMTGDITGNNDDSRYGQTGGIIGSVYDKGLGTTMTRLINYMTGNISNFHGAWGGGLIGVCTATSSQNTLRISNSIVAMNGRADSALIHYVNANGHPMGGGVDVVVNTDFGMTYATNDYAPAASVGEGFLEYPMLPDLPYVGLSGTDEKGNVYDWDFVFANVGGKDKYSAYTHASIHTGKVSAPFFTDFGQAVTGTHLAFANIGTGELFTDGSITAVVTDATTVFEYSLTTLETQASPIAIRTTVLPVTGAVDLKITYQGPDGDEQTAFTGFLGGEKSIEPLEPETEYTLRLYADMGTGSGYEFQEASLVPTLANTAENYQVQDFVENGKVRLDLLGSTAKTRISPLLNELFTTGDSVRVGVGSGAKGFADATFVNRGGTHPIKNVEALLLPFDAASGDSQTVNLQLSDNSTTTVVFDETGNTVAVESTQYSPGDTFIIDGLKCTVFEDT